MNSDHIHHYFKEKNFNHCNCIKFYNYSGRGNRWLIIWKSFSVIRRTS